ncbi:hypothetical protein LR48_Vigan02g079300 [Vigna angularis]|uniref:Uncharacterized protein n=1 Tax=Phaseolus angularis TaxID=3914 RepID=A0A0L9TVM1_PHAAN|nr:hypothetical protein LR48_Vigan02g079300 [Vigna angularis]
MGTYVYHYALQPYFLFPGQIFEVKAVEESQVKGKVLWTSCEFGERSEEGERWNQKRHKKVQKEESQLPLNGSLPLSGTQEFTGDPLRGTTTAEGKNRARALTAERVLCLMYAECNLVKNLTIWALNSIKVISTTGGNLTQAWIKVNFGKLPDNSRTNHNNNGSNKALKSTKFMANQFPYCQGNFNEGWKPHPSIGQEQSGQAGQLGQFNKQQQQPVLSGSLDETLQRFLKNSDSTQKSIEESCKRMEMHLRYISQRLNEEVNTEVNLKEEGQAIVTQSEKILDEKKIGGDEEKIERKEKEELSEKNKDEGWPPHRAKRIKTIRSKKRRIQMIAQIDEEIEIALTDECYHN